MNHPVAERPCPGRVHASQGSFPLGKACWNSTPWGWGRESIGWLGTTQQKDSDTAGCHKPTSPRLGRLGTVVPHVDQGSVWMNGSS